MSYETYQAIFIGAAIAAGVMLALSVFLFFFLKMPKVFGDVTGSTARKAVKAIREGNEHPGSRMNQSNPSHMQTANRTDRIPQAGNPVPVPVSVGTGLQTERLCDPPMPGGNETTLLAPEVYPTSGETTLLAQPQPEGDNGFELEYDITFVHSNEIIV